MKRSVYDHQLSIKRCSKEARYFRDQLRDARAVALSDAEAFHELLFSIERLGIKLTGKILNLGKYQPEICTLAQRSPLAESIKEKWGDWHPSFARLYDTVRLARNDALHQGAYARNLTQNALLLALVLEDALMDGMQVIGDYMVRGVLVAEPWQPMSLIRQQMLTNSFSFLPVLLENDGIKAWYLVSDHCVATYLRNGDRNQRLATSLNDALEHGEIELSRAPTGRFDEPINQVLTILERYKGLPLIICHTHDEEQLLGIVTAFDLL